MSIMIRHSDGKRFKVKFWGYWSNLEAEDGSETDVVNLYRENVYISGFSDGHKYSPA